MSRERVRKGALSSPSPFDRSYHKDSEWREG